MTPILEELLKVDEEVSKRLIDEPERRTLTQIGKFYARYGYDWIKRFYQTNISINSLPTEKDIEIGY